MSIAAKAYNGFAHKANLLHSLVPLCYVAVARHDRRDTIHHYQNIRHAYWAMPLVAILAFGPGKLSLDHLIRTLYERTQP